MGIFKNNGLGPIPDIHMNAAFRLFGSHDEADLSARDCLCAVDALLRVVVRTDEKSTQMNSTRSSSMAKTQDMAREADTAQAETPEMLVEGYVEEGAETLRPDDVLSDAIFADMCDEVGIRRSRPILAPCSKPQPRMRYRGKEEMLLAPSSQCSLPGSISSTPPLPLRLGSGSISSIPPVPSPSQSVNCVTPAASRSLNYNTLKGSRLRFPRVTTPSVRSETMQRRRSAG